MCETPAFTNSHRPKIANGHQTKFDHAWNTFAQVSNPVKMLREMIGGKVKFNIDSLIFGNACPSCMSYVLNRSGATGGSYESMKCIDLFNSKQLDALAGQYIKNNELA